jgi:hypothetical protein
MADAFDSLVMAAKQASFRVVGPGHYVKYNPLTGIRTTVILEGTGDTRTMHVRHDQRVDDILDLNVARQNDHKGFKGVDMFQATSIPMVEHSKIMAKCGYKPGQGYDVKKFKQILNDRDFYKFKTVPGRI